MTSRSRSPLAPPSWGFARRAQLGGLALVALWALLWALFLGTVGAGAHASRGPPGSPVASAALDGR